MLSSRLGRHSLSHSASPSRSLSSFSPLLTSLHSCTHSCLSFVHNNWARTGVLCDHDVKTRSVLLSQNFRTTRRASQPGPHSQPPMSASFTVLTHTDRPHVRFTISLSCKTKSFTPSSDSALAVPAPWVARAARPRTARSSSRLLWLNWPATTMSVQM